MKDETTDFLTTQQLARLWQVSEATIKRWADAGHLRPGKTLGGHRRFALSEVARFQRERGLEASAEAGKISRARAVSKALTVRNVNATATDRFFEAVSEADEEAATSLLLKLYLDRIPLAQILDQTLTDAMHRVGESWHGGEMSVADEHLASRTAIRTLEAVGQLLRRESVEARTVLCCAVEEELHDISLLCAQILLESEGWSVKNFGANTPLFALAITIEKHSPWLVCISSTVNAELDRNARDYPQVLSAAAKCGSRLVLGGEGFREPSVRQRFPADFYAESFTQFMEFAQGTISQGLRDENLA